MEEKRISSTSSTSRPKTAGRNAERPPSSRISSHRVPSQLGQSSATPVPISNLPARENQRLESRSQMRPNTNANLRSTLGSRNETARSRRPIGTPLRGMTASPMAATPSVLPFKPGTGLHRPVTQQGVSGIRSQSRMGSSFGQRQVADKTYFVGILNAQLQSLQNEINVLLHELDSGEKSRRNLLSYEQRAEEQAEGIKKLQAELAQLNLVINWRNTNADIRQLEFELDEKMRVGAAERVVLDALFIERRSKEETLQRLQEQINQVHEQNAQHIRNLDPELKSTVDNLNAEKVRLDSDIKSKQLELDALNASKRELDMALANSPLKQQALTLENNIRELEKKRSLALNKVNAEGTLEEQHKQLINHIQRDNEEISYIQQQIKDTSERIAQAQDEIHEFSNEFDIVASDRSQRYRELRHRDSQYNAFLEAFETTIEDVRTHITDLSAIVIRRLRIISENCELAELTAISNAAGVEESMLTMNASLNANELQDICVRLQDELESLERAKQRLTAELVGMRDKQKDMDRRLNDATDNDFDTKNHEIELDQNTKKNELLEKMLRLQADLTSIAERTAVADRGVSHLGSEKRITYEKIRQLKTRFDVAEAQRKSLSDKVDAITERNDIHSVRGEVNNLLIKNMSKRISGQFVSGILSRILL